MGKLEDAFWYFTGAGWIFTVPTFGIAYSGSRYFDHPYVLGFGATILTTWLCLSYRPAEPKRVALFGLLTLVGTAILGALTGTEGVRAPTPTLAKWVVGMLFAVLVVRFQLDKRIRSAIPYRS